MDFPPRSRKGIGGGIFFVFLPFLAVSGGVCLPPLRRGGPGENAHSDKVPPLFHAYALTCGDLFLNLTGSLRYSPENLCLFNNNFCNIYYQTGDGEFQGENPTLLSTHVYLLSAKKNMNVWFYPIGYEYIHQIRFESVKRGECFCWRMSWRYFRLCFSRIS